jgi:biopolymer transport protein ExbD
MNQRLKGRKKPIAEINITPFTDVILVLLVIFMITTPLLLKTSIKVNLPHAGNAEASDSKDEISVTVTDKSLIYLDGAPVTREELKEKVSLAYKTNPDLKVILFSDRLARFKDIVGVLDTMKGLGIHNLSLAAKTDSASR